MKNLQGAQNRPNTLENSLEHIFTLLDEDSVPKKPSELTASRLEQNILFNIKRHLASLNWLIDGAATRKVRPRTRKVLWWALAELLFLDGAPAHAVVDTATHFVKKHHAPPEAGFVNACLRKFSDIIERGDNPLKDAPEIVRLELTPLLWNRWCTEYGAEQTIAAARAMLRPSNVILRARTWPRITPLSEIPVELDPMTPPSWMPEAQLYTLNTHVDLTKLTQAYPQLYIQDPATLLAPALLAPAPGETIADLCAAPGGKARLIAEMMQNRGKLICRDKAEDKLQRLKQNLNGFTGVDIAAGDAAAPTLPEASLDALLLDVPCTNTGVIRRKPDAKWSFSSQKLNELTALQKQILDASAPLVKIGGRIVYSTCSIEPEENTRQVQDFLAAHSNFALEDSVQLLPDENHDGAFSARLRKKGPNS